MEIRILVPNADSTVPYQVVVSDVTDPFSPLKEGLVAAFRHKGDAYLFRDQLRKRTEKGEMNGTR